MGPLGMVIVQKDVVATLKILANQTVLDAVRVLGRFANLVYRKLHHVSVMNLVLDEIPEVSLHIGTLAPL